MKGNVDFTGGCCEVFDLNEENEELPNNLAQILLKANERNSAALSNQILRFMS